MNIPWPADGLLLPVVAPDACLCKDNRERQVAFSKTVAFKGEVREILQADGRKNKPSSHMKPKGIT